MFDFQDPTAKFKFIAFVFHAMGWIHSIQSLQNEKRKSEKIKVRSWNSLLGYSCTIL